MWRNDWVEIKTLIWAQKQNEGPDVNMVALRYKTQQQITISDSKAVLFLAAILDLVLIFWTKMIFRFFVF